VTIFDKHLTDDTGKVWADCIHTHVDIHFHWKDRIRILFGRTVYAHVKTFSEHVPGALKSSTDIHVAPIFRRRQRPCEGQGEVIFEHNPKEEQANAT
jgi:hypothetical protein